MKLQWVTKKAFTYAKDNDLGFEDAKNSKYIYDQNMTTVYPDYDKCVSKEKCDAKFPMGKRLSLLKYSERKALRLIFHDCVGYENNPGETGCDGCLNFDQNRYEKPHSEMLSILLKLDFFQGLTIKAYNTLQQF